jgi:hypothetical protein
LAEDRLPVLISTVTTHSQERVTPGNDRIDEDEVACRQDLLGEPGISPNIFRSVRRDSPLLLELKCLPELETKNRLNGDYVWLKIVFKF